MLVSVQTIMANAEREVVVVDTNIPLMSMVPLMIKRAIAAAPALFILFFIGGLSATDMGMMLGTGWHH